MFNVNSIFCDKIQSMKQTKIMDSITQEPQYDFCEYIKQFCRNIEPDMESGKYCTNIPEDKIHQETSFCIKCCAIPTHGHCTFWRIFTKIFCFNTPCKNTMRMSRSYTVLNTKGFFTSILCCNPLWCNVRDLASCNVLHIMMTHTNWKKQRSIQ